ncbi:MAG: signal peptidase I [Lachnospiraceae bacterium]|nr:signal peptidase I [Lachnospiraceae bacterium]
MEEEYGVNQSVGNDDEKTQETQNDPESDEITDKDLKKEKRGSELISWIVIIASAFVVAFVINRVVLLKTIVTSGSMRPTMEIGEHVIANRLAYLFSDPQRGDMVFFENPQDASEIYVKRIIGLPGEKVEIKNGKVYINDSEKALKEPYLFEKADKLDFGPYDVPENCYFMLGDNRNISSDSRYWDIHYVSRDKIYGKALFGYKVRLMKSAEY